MRALERANTRSKANVLLGGYCEQHHILPKCMDGTDEKSNLVFLSAREHFIAHILLVKIYPKTPGLLYACHRLMYDKQGGKERLNGKDYAALKLKISDYRKTRNKENDEGIARGADKRRGRTKDNYEPFAIGAEKQRGRTKDTHEGPRKISEKKLGQTKETCPGTAIMAEKLRGRNKDTHDYLRAAGEKRSILPKEVKEQVIARREAGQTFSSIHLWVNEELGYNVIRSAISNLYYRDKKRNKNCVQSSHYVI